MESGQGKAYRAQHLLAAEGDAFCFGMLRPIDKSARMIMVEVREVLSAIRMAV